MADHISQLRSRLRFTSDEFKNIINADLIDLKWKTFQMILIGMFVICPALEKEAEELQSLYDRRQKASSMERAAGVGRTDRNQAEHEYRLAFSQCVLDGLIKLEWPVAMVAFSNPLKDLMEDNTVKLGAIEFLVNVLNPLQTHQLHDQSDSRASESLVSSGQTPEKRQIRSATIQSTMNSGPSPRSSSSSCIHRQSERSALVTSVVSPDYECNSRSHNNVNHSSNIDASVGERSNSSRRRLDGADMCTIQNSLEILQFQNEQLTKALTSMMSAISSRDEIENDIERTLHDLTLAIAEISGPTISDKPEGSHTDVADKKKSSLKIEPKSLGEALTKTSGASAAGNPGPAPLWRAVHSRVESLYRQWMGARKSCRDAVIAQIEVHPASSKLFSIGGKGTPTTNRPSIKKGTAETKKRPFMTSLTEEGGDLKGFNTTFIDLSEIRPSTPPLQGVVTARSVSSIASRMSTSSSRMESVKHSTNSGGMALRIADPSTIRIYQMLGLRPPKSVLKREDTVGESASATFEFDRHRIFQLQRDLVAFSRAAFQVCCEDTIKDVSGELNTKVFSGTSVDKAHLAELQSASQKLLIDTSALAPLAPTNANFPMTSNITGLDALIAEFAELCSKHKNGAKLMQSESLTRAIERATTEQSALVQCLHFAKIHVQSSQKKEELRLNAGKEFREKVNIAIDKCDLKLKTALQHVRLVVSETANAENSLIELPTRLSEKDSRVNKGSSHGKYSNAVRPLDALSRGFLGAEVAALINSIRTFASNFEDIDGCLASLRRYVKNEISKELELTLAKLQL